MRVFLSCFLAIILLIGRALAAQAQPAYVSERKATGSFPLVADGQAAPLYVSETDWPGVQRTLRDVQADILRVTGREPQLLTDAPGAGQRAVVLVGTLGHSALLDQLVRAGRLDAAPLRGRWEKFVTQVIEHPLPGVARALVVAGSDQRGTIYGLYELSAQLGVSPWYWWADVPTTPRRQLYVAAGPYTLGEPAVRYRGLELPAPTLAAWVKTRYAGQLQPATERLIELLLRLRGNCLWPGALAPTPATLALLEQYGLEAPGPPDPATTYYPPVAASADSLAAGLPLLLAAPPARPRWLLRTASLKGQELLLSYFLAYAWSPAAFATPGAATAYVHRWAGQQFGADAAAAIAGLLPAALGAPRRDRAARQLAAEAQARLARAEALAPRLLAADQAAYFELVQYPAACAALQAELACLAARQREAQAQGHPPHAAELAAQASQVLAQAEALRRRYHSLLGGKWTDALAVPTTWLPPTGPARPSTPPAPPGEAQALSQRR